MISGGARAVLLVRSLGTGVSVRSNQRRALRSAAFAYKGADPDATDNACSSNFAFAALRVGGRPFRTVSSSVGSHNAIASGVSGIVAAVPGGSAIASGVSGIVSGVPGLVAGLAVPIVAGVAGPGAGDWSVCLCVFLSGLICS